MRRTAAAAVLLLLISTTAPCLGAEYTVWPSGQTNCTGYSDHAAKHDGPLLIYGGAATGTVRKGNGYLRFDTSAIPDTTQVSIVEWHFYVDTAYSPYWSVTPLSADPAALAGTPALVWEDLEAERDAGYYCYRSEATGYVPGWKSLVLGGSADTDLTALLAAGQDWFAFGGVSRDNVATYFLEIEGHDGTNVPYLVVGDAPPPVNDICAGAIAIPAGHGSHSYTGDTTYAANDYDCDAACVEYQPHAMNDLVWTVTLEPGDEVCALLNQSEMDWDGSLYLVTDCADVNGSCLAGSSHWYPGGEDEFCCYSGTNAQTCYIVVDGRDGTGAGPFRLDVEIRTLSAPSGLQCTEQPWGDVDLAWVNNESYDTIEVRVDGALNTTLDGSSTAATIAPGAIGYLGISVCGVLGAETSCSEHCRLLMGYNWEETLWDFNADDGGFIVDGTGGWQWGHPTQGPCSDTADGNVWATDLDADYSVGACWLLDSSQIDIGGGAGAYLAVDHCYDTEAGFDGGTVWFTTDDYWYYNIEPLDGFYGALDGSYGGNCSWTYGPGVGCFSGDSGGWVTDVWDFTGDMWDDEVIKIRFACGSDSTMVHSGWMIDNVKIYWNFTPYHIYCDYSVTPPAGTVPFQTTHRLSLGNLFAGGDVYTRRIAGRISVTIGNGSFFTPWRAGYTNVAPGSVFTTSFPVTLPALASVIGNNTFTLRALDVTPAPYNQPPYPSSGSTCSRTGVVVASTP